MIAITSIREEKIISRKLSDLLEVNGCEEILIAGVIISADKI